MKITQNIARDKRMMINVKKRREVDQEIENIKKIDLDQETETETEIVIVIVIVIVNKKRNTLTLAPDQSQREDLVK